MSGALPPRPEPPRGVGEQLSAWLAWVGVTRLVVSAVSVAAVVAGVAWLVRAPSPSTESALPFTGSSVAATLPPPTTQPPAAPTTALPTHVYVHVAGAVAAPGVYELAAGDRVTAAIAAAGGPGPDAELDGLNLAAPVVDGQRIYVPAVGEVDLAAVPSGPATAPGPEEESATTMPVGPIDLNTATAAQLDTLPGVGPATAAAIVDDRERHGPFAAVDDLQRVPGIGPAKLAAVVDLVTV